MVSAATLTAVSASISTPVLPRVRTVAVISIRDFAPSTDSEFNEPVILFVLIGYTVAIWAIGFSIPTIGLILWMLFKRAGMRLVPGIVYGTIVFGIVWLLFDILRGDAPVGAFTGLS